MLTHSSHSVHQPTSFAMSKFLYDYNDKPHDRSASPRFLVPRLAQKPLSLLPLFTALLCDLTFFSLPFSRAISRCTFSF